MNTIYFAWSQIQTASNEFVTFSLISLKCQQQTSIYWPYSQVDNYVRDRVSPPASYYIESLFKRLYKTDTSLRRTVEAGLDSIPDIRLLMINRDIVLTSSGLSEIVQLCFLLPTCLWLYWFLSDWLQVDWLWEYSNWSSTQLGWGTIFSQVVNRKCMETGNENLAVHPLALLGVKVSESFWQGRGVTISRDFLQVTPGFIKNRSVN